MKQTSVDRIKKTLGCSVIVGRKEPKSELLNDEIKVAVERKEVVGKYFLGAMEGITKAKCIEIYGGKSRANH